MHLKTHLLVASAELLQATFCLVNRFDPFLSFAVSSSEDIFEGIKPGIELDDAFSGQAELRESSYRTYQCHLLVFGYWQFGP